MDRRTGTVGNGGNVQGKEGEKEEEGEGAEQGSSILLIGLSLSRVD